MTDLHVLKNEEIQQLSSREKECLYWAAQGKSSQETAVILQLKAHSINTYRNRIKEKLKCTTMIEAVYKAMKNGMLI